MLVPFSLCLRNPLYGEDGSPVDGDPSPFVSLAESRMVNGHDGTMAADVEGGQCFVRRSRTVY